MHGDILLNGCQIGPFMRRLSGFVYQDDIFYASLTVLEHLTCMAHLKLDRRISAYEVDSIIKDVMERTGLTKCAKTRIGEGDAGKMLSGGEKKRLAFATELLTQPAILFCDEPTTGLDAYNAKKIVETLQELAYKRNTAVLCTIHQPSSELFAMFDQVLLLSEGRVAFFGEPDDAVEFFGDYGYKCPVNFNPAEYLISVLSAETGSCERTSLKTASRLCDLFAVSEASQQRDLLVNLEMHMYEKGSYEVQDELNGFTPPLWITTFYWLTWRSLLTVLRDPTVQLLRILQKAAIAVTAGLCFMGSINMSQSGIQAVGGVLFVLVAENTFTPMYSVLAVFPQTFPLFLRELKSGIYTTDQYYLSSIVAMVRSYQDFSSFTKFSSCLKLPGLIVEPLIFVMIAYWLAQLRPTFFAFLITTISSTLIMNVSTACGCFFSAAFNSVPIAMAYLVPFDYILMITSGFFMKLDTLPKMFSWIRYFSWLMYGNEAMTIAQFDGVTNISEYEQCLSLTAFHIISILACSLLEPEALPCFRSGDEVLENLGFSTNHLYINFAAMFLIYVLFHLLGYLCMCRRSKSF